MIVACAFCGATITDGAYFIWCCRPRCLDLLTCADTMACMLQECERAHVEKVQALAASNRYLCEVVSDRVAGILCCCDGAFEACGGCQEAADILKEAARLAKASASAEQRHRGDRSGAGAGSAVPADAVAASLPGLHMRYVRENAAS